MKINLNTVDVTELNKHPLYPVLAEIKAASDAVRCMDEIGVGNFHLFELSWQNFLQSLDRCWNKLQATCYGKKGWQTLESKIVNKRKKDQLLNYLIQARNATEHSISPVIKEWDANLTATPNKSGIMLSWAPYDRPLLNVNNRGQIFLPPKEHLGKPMSFYKIKYPQQSEPIVAAILAMNFYVDCINKVSEKIFSENEFTNENL